MIWKYCKAHNIKFKGDTCPECSKNKNVKFKVRRGGEFRETLEDRNEDYIKRELGI